MADRVNSTLAGLQRAEEFKRRAKSTLDPEKKLAYLAASVDVLIEAVTEMARAEAVRDRAEAA